MAKRQPKAAYLVAGHGHREIVPARSPGNAVCLFRRMHGLTLRTDSETGG